MNAEEVTLLLCGVLIGVILMGVAAVLAVSC